MDSGEKACCAHLRVEFWPVQNEDGSKTERWICSDLCGQEFDRKSVGNGYCESCGGPHHNHMLGRLRFAIRATRSATPTSLGARLRMLLCVSSDVGADGRHECERLAEKINQLRAAAGLTERDDPYLGCSIYRQHGACSCSTGVAGNVCPLGTKPEGSDGE